jgi:hypothetical protein
LTPDIEETELLAKWINFPSLVGVAKQVPCQGPRADYQIVRQRGCGVAGLELRIVDDGGGATMNLRNRILRIDASAQFARNCRDFRFYA